MGASFSSPSTYHLNEATMQHSAAGITKGPGQYHVATNLGQREQGIPASQAKNSDQFA